MTAKLNDILTWKLLNGYNVALVKDKEPIYFDFIDNHGDRLIYEANSIEDIYSKIIERYNDYWDSLDNCDSKDQLEYTIRAFYIDRYNGESRDIAEYSDVMDYNAPESVFDITDYNARVI